VILGTKFCRIKSLIFSQVIGTQLVRMCEKAVEKHEENIEVKSLKFCLAAGIHVSDRSCSMLACGKPLERLWNCESLSESATNFQEFFLFKPACG
jgi:hypothetical protein